MSKNRTNLYDIESHIGEVYDRQVTETDDVELIQRLIDGLGPLRILEPFCGTGRILIPLALDGHDVVGLDQARGMLERARLKIRQLPADVQNRIALLKADATADEWPKSFDMVVLGANCFYELATAEEQEHCIAAASDSLRAGGYVYVDNAHMEGELDESWRRPGVWRGRFPTGTCADGTLLEGSSEAVWFDPGRRLAKSRRTIRAILPDGSIVERQYVQQKHPCSTGEVRGWLERHGFAVEELFGDRSGVPYTPAAGRAIFWARKTG